MTYDKLYDIIRGTGYCSSSQSDEIAELIMEAIDLETKHKNKKFTLKMLKELLLIKYGDRLLDSETDENILSISFNDPYLTDELYENGVMITRKFLKELTKFVDIVTSDFPDLKVIVEEQDKSWVGFELKVK